MSNLHPAAIAAQLGRTARARLARLALPVALLAILLPPSTAYALDYDLNDLADRELGIGGALAPTDVDPRGPAKCPTSSAICANVTQPFGTLLRGTARRHRGHLYMSTELLLGLTWPTGSLPAHPWFAVGGAIGAETAADGYARVRGYGEFGADIVWTNSSVFDILHVFTEVGLRLQVQQYGRPHTLLFLGARALSNLDRIGLGIFGGVGFTFD
ncbi:MAG: hypothetical protein HY902_19935 [Deltaproteobacteria bacterium]|nr:hypothetical protein [Deltaproteobacteria bacterium]